ncbi:MAG TPA: hypothetical protein VFM93_05745 [Candidatus Limnocylindria bacterium]|nr:hypothetical protein [Candidatus Limnocylindria bacterium]
MQWLEVFLDRLDDRECRVCGASLRDARTVVERSAEGRMTAVLYCRTCRARNLAGASKAA